MSTTSSPPPTPPSKTPGDDEFRFKTITSPCEWVEDYHPGGYHPVHLGDIFHGGRYRVIRKLGDGSYSTVWLASDLKNDRYIALKILVSDISGSTAEPRILHHTAQLSSGMPESWPITQLLDEFDHKGPNGIHKCLVFEAMGPSVNTMVEELPQFNPRKWGMKIRYPTWMAKSILKQSLQALVILHGNGIAHGDFQPGNMLFDLDQDIHSQPESVLRQVKDEQIGSISPPVQRLDGKPDQWAPQYLCIDQPLASFTPYSEGFIIKLSDLGGAYFFTDPPKKPITPLGLRAPELVLFSTVNRTTDVWSFGCLVFELVTGQPLFCVPGTGFEDDEHLLALTALLRPLPSHLYEAWKGSHLYFTPERELYNCELGGVPEGGKPLMLEQVPMEDMFDRAEPEISEDEARQVKALIRRILRYDPNERPSPAEILSDPWFVGS